MYEMLFIRTYLLFFIILYAQHNVTNGGVLTITVIRENDGNDIKKSDSLVHSDSSPKGNVIQV